MAKFPLTNAYVLLNAVDLSTWVKSITLNTSADIVDATGMGATWHTNLAGLKDWSLSIEFEQDFAASAVDQILWPSLGASISVEIRPTSAGRSATNPAYTGTGLISTYNPIGGSVGDLAMAPVTIVASSNLVRNIA